ncbi:MAG: hypothetical protein IKF91_01995 [Bacilli bacterium]|nr:hypothetical protein [Bacilli bacterium]
MEEKQELFILIDDSGKLNSNETSCIYGGLFFYSSKEYMNFINKYKSIIKKIKCDYCSQKKISCNNKCLEIKGTTKLKQKHKRWLFNLLKKQYNFGVFINNNKIYKNIMNNKSARGRFTDYSQKRIIKEIVLYSVKNKKISINKPLYLYIKSDEYSSKSNGYYKLEESIYEELINGIINFDYSKIHKPILKNKLYIKYTMYSSKKHYGIQSADFIAHYLHSEYNKSLLNGKDITKDINFIEVKLFLP